MIVNEQVVKLQTFDNNSRCKHTTVLTYMSLNWVYYCTSITREFYVCLKPNIRASAKMTFCTSSKCYPSQRNHKCHIVCVDCIMVWTKILLNFKVRNACSKSNSCKKYLQNYWRIYRNLKIFCSSYRKTSFWFNYHIQVYDFEGKYSTSEGRKLVKFSLGNGLWYEINSVFF